MSLYTDIYAVATDAAHVLRKQTSVAIVKAALDIMAESDATARHPERLTWARRVINDPSTEAGRVIWKVLENAGIRADVLNQTDTAVQAVVSAAVNAFLTMR